MAVSVVFLPPEEAGEPSREHPYIDLRYPFADVRTRLRFPDLVVGILDRLAKIHGSADHEREPEAVGWEEFEATTDDEITTLGEALFETAHLIAGLAAADGAVVMSKHNEILGFGGMISGRLPDVESVGRALDLEGERVAEEVTGNVGARHRSAYRLAGALLGSVAVVISQDGACASCARETAASRTGSKSKPPRSAPRWRASSRLATALRCRRTASPPTPRSSAVPTHSFAVPWSVPPVIPKLPGPPRRSGGVEGLLLCSPAM
ncbi:MAG: hypothetical protein AVDCRST_MAG02-2474 [uncultured Rubrobacteraceae bacterium]|uniref:DAC domain-containing protein n=1 Tax=uncultured Rubrobacteraceae bacterium TaxID=349277 RepID=A0A6J4R4M8_9ACTN|nr:MAG: hypothetical protein AVDCRST_MAG02-2474 [uncultured Rubrobacteraceae bacterium]